MTNATIVKHGIILSALVAANGFTGQYAYAYPKNPIVSVAVSSPFLTRIDTRSYRHCHNKPPNIHRVTCYTTKPGDHAAPAPRQPHRDSGAAKDKSRSYHHHARHRWLPW